MPCVISMFVGNGYYILHLIPPAPAEGAASAGVISILNGQHFSLPALSWLQSYGCLSWIEQGFIPLAFASPSHWMISPPLNQIFQMAQNTASRLAYEIKKPLSTIDSLRYPWKSMRNHTPERIKGMPVNSVTDFS